MYNDKEVWKFFEAEFQLKHA